MRRLKWPRKEPEGNFIKKVDDEEIKTSTSGKSWIRRKLGKKRSENANLRKMEETGLYQAKRKCQAVWIPLGWYVPSDPGFFVLGPCNMPCSIWIGDLASRERPNLNKLEFPSANSHGILCAIKYSSPLLCDRKCFLWRQSFQRRVS
jgi:hypothetical protein